MGIEVNKALIRRVAANARLNLSESELDRFVPQIKEIVLGAFDKLDEIDAKEEASFQPVVVKNKFREDNVKVSLSHEEVFKNVKKELRQDNYVKGPKAL